MIIANFTPDTISYVHGGIPGELKSGEMTDMPEKKANFILNKYDQRGLCTLQFGDDPEACKKKAMEVYREFWTRQIINHNQANEARQARNLEYSKPEKDVLKHANELGLKVLGPWQVNINESVELTNIKNENAELRVQVNQMSSQLAQLIKALEDKNVPEILKTPAQKFPAKMTVESAPIEPVKEAEPSKMEKAIKEKPDSKIQDEIKNLSKKKLVAWVMDNAGVIMNDFDFATQAFIKDTWNSKCESVDWPLPM